MLKLTEANERRIREFMSAHEQHGIKFEILREYSGELFVKVHLNYHNGHDWMGCRGVYSIRHVNKGLRRLFRDAKEMRPDLFRGLLR